MLAVPAGGRQAAEALAVDGVPEIACKFAVLRLFHHVPDMLRIGMKIEKKAIVLEADAMGVSVEQDEMSPRMLRAVTADAGEDVPPMLQFQVVVIHQVD